MAVPGDSEVLERYPGLPIDHDNKEYYRGLLQRKLLLNRCGGCRHWHQPPRALCPRCWSDDVRAEEVGGRGTVALATVLHLGAPAPGVDYTRGHPVVAVQLDEQVGLRFTASLIGCPPEAARIGLPVELTWTERDGAPYPAFRPEGAWRG